MYSFRSTQVGDLVDMVLEDAGHYLDTRWAPAPTAAARERAMRMALRSYVATPAEKERYGTPAEDAFESALMKGEWEKAAALADAGPDPASDLAFIGPAILYLRFIDGLLDRHVSTYGGMSTDEQGRYIYR